MKIEANVVVSQFAGLVERVRRRVVEAVARDARRPRQSPERKPEETVR